jgi:predicted phosphodiesterase
VRIRVAVGVAVGIVVAVASIGGWTSAQQAPALPNASDSLKFGIIGDNGTGSKAQYEVGQQMASTHSRFPFELVIMLGDNMYGSQQRQDFILKFERPYAALLEQGVRFFAALGNHDDPNNRHYAPFNMGGERYYTFARRNVRFFVLDTNALDAPQVTWFKSAVAAAREPWKIAYFHHPLYSNAGRHGSNVELRVALEPLLVEHGIDVVFSGHDHAYERFKPQKGITYFLAGSGGQLRKGDIQPSALTAAAFDQDQAFMVAEVSGDELSFQAISRTGRVVDSGIIQRNGRD